MTFTGYQPTEDNKYKFDISLSKDGKNYKISPIMYISDFNNGLMREPAILNMWIKDIYISPLGYAPNSDENKDTKVVSLQKGNAVDFNGVKITFENFNFPPEVREAMMAGKDFKIGVDLSANYKGEKKVIEVALKNSSGKRELTSYNWNEADLKVELLKIDASEKKIDLAFSKLKDTSSLEPKEVLSITASVKPFINLVWSGVLVMVFGFFISVARRLKESIVHSNPSKE
jgi:cytochrome c-type biogenesis protein CcmF